MLSEDEWENLRPKHRVPGDRSYGGSTYAWMLAGVQRIPAIPIRRKRGSVIWQTGPGGAGGSAGGPAAVRGPGFGGHWCIRRPGGSVTPKEWRHGDLSP